MSGVRYYTISFEKAGVTFPKVSVNSDIDFYPLLKRLNYIKDGNQMTVHLLYLNNDHVTITTQYYDVEPSKKFTAYCKYIIYQNLLNPANWEVHSVLNHYKLESQVVDPYFIDHPYPKLLREILKISIAYKSDETVVLVNNTRQNEYYMCGKYYKIEG